MIIMPELLSSEGHKCSSSLDYYTTYPHTWKFTSTDTTLLEYNYTLPLVNDSVNES